MRSASLILALFVMGCGAKPAPRRTILVDRNPARIVKRGPPPLRFAVQLDKRFVKAGAPGEVIARLRITTAKDVAVQRTPVNLGLVVDTSGSMAGKAIAHARKAALAMVAQLKPGDRIAIVVFNSESRVLVPSTVIDGESRPRIVSLIRSIKARGTTDLAGGLSRGIGQVRSGMRPGAIHRVVLLSDGIPNDRRNLMRHAQYARRNGITITALGLGLDYDETLLGALARTTGGAFHFIRDPAQVAKVFREEVIRMRQVIAQRLALRILPGPGIVVRRVFGRAVTRHGRYTSVHLGGMRAREQRDVLIQLRVPARRDGATIELMDGLVTYTAKTLGRGFGYRQKLYLAAGATADDQKIAAGRTKGFALSMARALAAQSTIDAIALARGRQLKQALALLDGALAAARLAAVRFNDDKLTAQIKQMVKLRAALPSLVPRVQRIIRRHGRRGRRYLKPHRRRMAPIRPSAPVPGAAATIRKAHSSANRLLSK